VLTGKSLIASLVVAGDSGHKLLRITLMGCAHFGQEVVSIASTQCRRHTPVVQDLKLTISSDSVAEAKVLTLRF
jgi:hypothetical protein